MLPIAAKYHGPCLLAAGISCTKTLLTLCTSCACQATQTFSWPLMQVMGTTGRTSRCLIQRGGKMSQQAASASTPWQCSTGVLTDMPYHNVRYNTMWQSTQSPESTAQPSTAHHGTAQHTTPHHSTPRHSTAQHTATEHPLVVGSNRLLSDTLCSTDINTVARICTHYLNVYPYHLRISLFTSA